MSSGEMTEDGEACSFANSPVTSILPIEWTMIPQAETVRDPARAIWVSSALAQVNLDECLACARLPVRSRSHTPNG
jgi:hypothetical protein